MGRIYLFCFLLFSTNAFTQVLTTYQPIHSQPKVQFDYWVYSTHGTNGDTSQYPRIPTNEDEMDDIFNTSNSNTELFEYGKTSSARILDWLDADDLSDIDISLPNSNNYFAIKIQGTFIPTETGNYIFTLEADDASDLFINGTSVIATYMAQPVPALGTNTGNISLDEGKSYTFQARMNQGTGGFGLRMYWKSPSQNSAPTSYKSVHPSNTYYQSWTQNLEELVTKPDMDGTTAEKAAPSAKYIQTAFNNYVDGEYFINLPVVGPTKLYCLLSDSVDGGGWMMAMKSSRGTTFEYDSSHWTSIDTLNPTQSNRSDGDAKFNSMNYFHAKDIMALWPDIPSDYGSSSTGGSVNTSSSYNSWNWLQNNFNNGIRISLIDFFTSADNLFFGDAKNYSGYGSAFSSQKSIRFYGFNYTKFADKSVRWGFGWNENDLNLYPVGNQSSNDVSGGIGMKFNSYSAGDSIGCCQDSTGINSDARVEIYIR